MIPDQDRQIVNLKREISSLRQNEKDYADLNFLLTNLQHRYNLLNEQKQRMQNDYYDRNEAQCKTVAQLRTEVDRLKEELESKNDIFNELNSELRAVKDVSEHRAIDVERLRSQLKQCFDVNNRLREDNDACQDNLRRHRDEKKLLLERMDNINLNVQEIIEQNHDLQRVIEEEVKDQRNLESLNLQLQEEYQKLNEEYRDQINHLQSLQDQCSENLKIILGLEQENNELNFSIEQLRHSLENEKLGRNSDNEKSTQYAENVAQKEEELQQLEENLRNVQREHDNLKKANNELYNSKNQSNNEVEQLMKNSEILMERIDDLSSKLQEYKGKYEELARILDQKEKEKRGLEREKQELYHEVEQCQNQLRDRQLQIGELEGEVQKSIEAILKYENEKNENHKDYYWLQNELEEAQMRTKNEIDRNIDLVNASRELEELIRIKDEEINDVHQEVSEIKLENAQLNDKIKSMSIQMDRMAKINEKFKMKSEQLNERLNEGSKTNYELSQKFEEMIRDQKQIDQLNHDLHSECTILTQELNKKNELLMNIDRDSQEFSSAIQKLEGDNQQMSKQLETAKISLRQAQQALENEYNKTLNIKQDYSSKQEDIRHKENEIMELKRVIQSIESKNQDERRGKNQLAQQLSNLEGKYEKLQQCYQEAKKYNQDMEKQQEILKALVQQKRALREFRLKGEEELQQSLLGLKESLEIKTKQK